MPDQNGLTGRQRSFLQALFPGEDYLDAPEKTCVYGTDASRCFALSWAVVRPRKLGQVRELLRFAHLEHIPLFPPRPGHQRGGRLRSPGRRGGGILPGA